MSAFPVRAKGAIRFTPEALEHLDTPPVFLLRTAKWEDKVQISGRHKSLGLTFVTEEDRRDAIIEGLLGLYDAESADHGQARLKAYWDAIDDLAARQKQLLELHRDASDADKTELEKKIATLEFGFPIEEARDLDTLTKRIEIRWPACRDLNEESLRFEAYYWRIIIAVLCSGWEGLDTPFARNGDMVDLESLANALDEVTALEKKHGLPEGIATMQLQVKAMQLMRNTREEEKNSPSLPSEPSTPASSSPAEMTAQKSKASDTSPASPESA